MESAIMTFTDLLLIILPAAIIGGFLFVRYYLLRNRCPHCGSRRHWRIEREVEEVMPVDMIMGHGGAQQLMSTIKETYRCRKCGRTWTETFGEI
jgi:DNA-directed RNA polymerase subunit RPC12/RpoP